MLVSFKDVSLEGMGHYSILILNLFDLGVDLLFIVFRKQLWFLNRNHYLVV